MTLEVNLFKIRQDNIVNNTEARFSPLSEADR
jgi:hypothetical protein